ncbi:class A beta-lactamase [Carnobacterium divergens]|uniref:class A beta-lactamase n=1 Tax=Carnobacterium divergens TaxID=2748 RepID=UPI001072C2B3|nr:class A beta-lactamase [Carnobacterium divergens]MDT1996989.1 class A beta-lactamase [Carnobacterium divergens]TFI73808.1 class A beta-lactamase [Carnobacterium divergens]TFI85840.1 class A beta-lactamase [Carnobacterium divergens]TFI93839.1 class A beta-lactamase [Carnobacterium divergens]TFI94592.1 class A beta-lactamase [Carnobacterium divergens]
MKNRKYVSLLVITLGVALVVGAGAILKPSKDVAKTKIDTKLQKKNASLNFEKLEKKYDATLGVYGLDTETNKVVAYNEDQRFAFASTYKALAGGLVLNESSWDELNQTIMIKKEDLVTYSPITEKYVDIGMPLKELISAAIQYSDNTAGNFLFKQLGGPKGFQTKLAELGDYTTDSSRFETELNEATPGDIRDTSTPKEIALDLKKLAIDHKLPTDKLEFYKKQLIENTTGSKLIRAGIPSDVIVGDKSGAGSYGTRNDIAVLYPPNRKPIVLVIFSNKEQQESDYNDELIAETAKIVSDDFNL